MRAAGVCGGGTAEDLPERDGREGKQVVDARHAREDLLRDVGLQRGVPGDPGDVGTERSDERGGQQAGGGRVQSQGQERERAEDAEHRSGRSGLVIVVRGISALIVSRSAEQDPALQLDALGVAGCSWVFTDHASGSREDRPELAAALEHLRPAVRRPRGTPRADRGLPAAAGIHRVPGHPPVTAVDSVSAGPVAETLPR